MPFCIVMTWAASQLKWTLNYSERLVTLKLEIVLEHTELQLFQEECFGNLFYIVPVCSQGRCPICYTYQFKCLKLIWWNFNVQILSFILKCEFCRARFAYFSSHRNMTFYNRTIRRQICKFKKRALKSHLDARCVGFIHVNIWHILPVASFWNCSSHSPVHLVFTCFPFCSSYSCFNPGLSASIPTNSVDFLFLVNDKPSGFIFALRFLLFLPVY